MSSHIEVGQGYCAFVYGTSLGSGNTLWFELATFIQPHNTCRSFPSPQPLHPVHSVKHQIPYPLFYLLNCYTFISNFRLGRYLYTYSLVLLCKFQNTRTESLFVSLRVAGIFTLWCSCACFRHPAAAVRPAEMPGRQAGDGGVHCGRAPGVLQAAGGGGAGLCSQP